MIKSVVEFIRNQPVRFFALVCVAATSAYIMWICWVLVSILSSPDWCSKAIQAERITPGASFEGLTGCIDILKIQLKSLATNSHIGFGVIALCLLTLMVIVVAGGHLSLGSKLGNVNIGKGPVSPTQAAEETAQAAVDKAEQIAEALPGEDEK